MNELISIKKETIGDSEINAVNARDLHSFLEVKTKFNDWIDRKIKRYEFVINSDYSIMSSATGFGGEDRKDYIITIDMAKELSMVERNEKGKEARKYFIEVEKAYKKSIIPNFDDPIAAAEAWIAEKKKTLLLEEKIKEQTPKVEYFDDLVSKNLNTSFRESAKELKVPERKFIKFLEDKKFIYRDAKKKIQPYAQYVPELFEIKEWKSDHKAGQQTLITPKGRETFRLLTEHLKK